MTHLYKIFFCLIFLTPAFVANGDDIKFRSSKWNYLTVILRSSELRLWDSNKKGVNIFDGRKNSVLTIEQNSIPDDLKIGTSIIVDIGGYYKAETIVGEVSYKFDYYAESWHRSISYTCTSKEGDAFSFVIYFDEKGINVEDISGFVVFIKQKKPTLHFELKGWINLSTE